MHRPPAPATEWEGEAEYHIGRGILSGIATVRSIKGKHVAVIGGGNSGIEAAIDLASSAGR